MSSNQGILYLNDGQQPGRSNTAITSYRSNADHYCLSNFDDNGRKGYNFFDPDLNKVVHFQTAEHYLHFQKLNKEGKEKYLTLWSHKEVKAATILNLSKKEEFLKNNNGSISKNKYFVEKKYWKYDWTSQKDRDNWDKNKVAVQQQINLSKYQQSQKFRDSIQTSINAGKSFNDSKGALQIIEDTATAKNKETNWGTGPDGTGTNILGNSQTAFANAIDNNLLTTNSLTPSFNDANPNNMQQLYEDAVSNYKKDFQETLKNVRAKASSKIAPNKKEDTADLNSYEATNPKTEKKEVIEYKNQKGEYFSKIIDVNDLTNSTNLSFQAQPKTNNNSNIVAKPKKNHHKKSNRSTTSGHFKYLCGGLQDNDIDQPNAFKIVQANRDNQYYIRFYFDSEKERDAFLKSIVNTTQYSKEKNLTASLTKNQFEQLMKHIKREKSGRNFPEPMFNKLLYEQNEAKNGQVRKPYNNNSNQNTSKNNNSSKNKKLSNQNSNNYKAKQTLNNNNNNRNVAEENEEFIVSDDPELLEAIRNFDSSFYEHDEEKQEFKITRSGGKYEITIDSNGNFTYFKKYDKDHVQSINQDDDNFKKMLEDAKKNDQYKEFIKTTKQVSHDNEQPNISKDKLNKLNESIAGHLHRENINLTLKVGKNSCKLSTVNKGKTLLIETALKPEYKFGLSENGDITATYNGTILEGQDLEKAKNELFKIIKYYKLEILSEQFNKKNSNNNNNSTNFNNKSNQLSSIRKTQKINTNENAHEEEFDDSIQDKSNNGNSHESNKKKPSTTLETDNADACIKIFNDYAKEKKWDGDTCKAKKREDGKIELTFPTEKDAMAFFNKEAQSHHKFKVYDANNDLLLTSDGKGNLRDAQGKPVNEDKLPQVVSKNDRNKTKKEQKINDEQEIKKEDNNNNNDNNNSVTNNISNYNNKPSNQTQPDLFESSVVNADKQKEKPEDGFELRLDDEPHNKKSAFNFLQDDKKNNSNSSSSNNSAQLELFTTQNGKIFNIRQGNYAIFINSQAYADSYQRNTDTGKWEKLKEAPSQLYNEAIESEEYQKYKEGLRSILVVDENESDKLLSIVKGNLGITIRPDGSRRFFKWENKGWKDAHITGPKKALDELYAEASKTDAFKNFHSKYNVTGSLIVTERQKDNLLTIKKGQWGITVAPDGSRRFYTLQNNQWEDAHKNGKIKKLDELYAEASKTDTFKQYHNTHGITPNSINNNSAIQFEENELEEFADNIENIEDDGPISIEEEKNNSNEYDFETKNHTTLNKMQASSSGISNSNNKNPFASTPTLGATTVRGSLVTRAWAGNATAAVNNTLRFFAHNNTMGATQQFKEKINNEKNAPNANNPVETVRRGPMHR